VDAEVEAKRLDELEESGVANKALWPALDAAISRHKRVEFSSVKAH
jgi:ribonuclease HI